MNYSTCFRSALLPLIFIGLSGAAYSAQEEWVKPQQLIVDKIVEHRRRRHGDEDTAHGHSRFNGRIGSVK